MSDSKGISSAMNIFERYLTLWVLACIVVGIALGELFSDVFHFIGGIEVAHINLPVAVLVWLMIIPMLIKIDFRELKGVGKHWRGVGVLVEVPVMLVAVRVVNRSRDWYERRSDVPTYEECCPATPRQGIWK